MNYLTWVRNFAVECTVLLVLGGLLGGGIVWWVRGLQVHAAEGQIAQLQLDLKQAEVNSLEKSRTDGEQAINDLKGKVEKIDQVATDVRRIGKRISLCDANGGSVQVPAVPEGTDAEAEVRRTRPAEEVLRELAERLIERGDKQAEACNTLIELIEKSGESGGGSSK